MFDDTQTIKSRRKYARPTEGQIWTYRKNIRPSGRSRGATTINFIKRVLFGTGMSPANKQAVELGSMVFFTIIAFLSALWWV